VSEHVSALVLDELASGPGPSNAHVESCEQCRAKLNALKTQAQASRASFGYARTKARVLAPKPSPWRWVALVATPLVAAGLFFVALHSGQQEGDRLKGTPSIDFVRADGVAVTDVRPGTHLKLKVGAAGFTHALALAVDDKGAVEQLWPQDGADDTLPGRGVVMLPRELEATPGPVTVHVLLSQAPIDSAKAKADVDAALKAAAGSASKRLNVSP
jgi:hypothetical protein